MVEASARGGRAGLHVDSTGLQREHMKTMKLLTAAAFAAAMMSTSTFSAEEPQAKCCATAKKAGKECAHPCCVEAKKDDKVCGKCPATEGEKKPS
jgi:hypothetical protein